MKSALLGCGGRARGHANAYQHVTKGELAAICDLDEQRLHGLGDHFGIDTRYTDVHKMLDEVKPDLLHIVTQPHLRVQLLTLAHEHNVPAVLVEKPIALQGEDYNQLVKLEAESDTKFAVNHQLHFHKKSLELQEAAESGAVGERRFIDASARLNLSGQGTHVLELVSAFNSNSAPTSVFGQVAGGGSIGGGGHSAPEQCVAIINYENGTQAQLLCGTNARPINENGARHMHKRIAVYGTKGVVHWTMAYWERTLPNGDLERGDHSYGAEDVVGQAGLTDAMFEWSANDDKPCPTNLSNSLTQFNIILGIYMSALQHRPVNLPVEPDEDLLSQLKARL